MISICVTVKNRSRVVEAGRELMLFPRCVDAIEQAILESGVGVELVVADWMSDDWPLLEWLRPDARDFPVKVVTLKGSFSRGRGRNEAAAQANHDDLLFLDADCLVSSQTLLRGAELLASGKSYFPVVYSFSDPDHSTGWWRHEGFGNCFVRRDVYHAAGGWPDYPRWGREDDHFYARVAAVSEVVRDEAKGFFHQWHPNDVDWKDRYVVVSEAELAERRALAEAVADLAQVIPAEHSLALVDEARIAAGLVARVLPGRLVRPFVENDGDYWGPPADDQSAIAELRRQQRLGVTFIAFIFPAFWWLDYYRGFAQVLADCGVRVLQNRRVVVFQLAADVVAGEPPRADGGS